MYVCGFKCVECGSEHSPGDIRYVCPKCGGNLDVQYDYQRIAALFTRAQLASDRNHTMWRYRSLLTIDSSSSVPPLTVGWTPIYECKSLAETARVRRLLIKDDGRNPTGSFKDRPSALAVVKAQEAGSRVITTASSGNAGSALAGMCASVGMRTVIFVPVDAPEAKVAQLIVYGANVVLVEGSYDDAYELCLRAADRFDWYQRSTGYNPFMSEGKKTAAFEIAEQLNWQVPDKVLVAVGDGCIIGGLWKGFNDLFQLGLINRLPQLVGVQSEKASAVVDAANTDGILRSGSSQTIADSINVGKPRDATKAIRAIRESGGLGIKVSDDEIIASIPRLARASGVFAEPAGAAPLAGLLKLAETGVTRGDEDVLLMITGNGLKDIGAARRVAKEPVRVKPDIDVDQLNFETSV